MLPDFELIPHTADIQIRVYGSTQAELFKNALIGMFQVIGPVALNCTKNNDRIICPALDRHHEITLQAYDTEQLLVDFLSQALVLSDTYNEAYFDATCAVITATTLEATIYGVMVTGFAVEIKAVTYHNLEITEHNGIWQTDIVFDI
jgi:protein archease